jgi:hypothetical protein
MDECRHRHYRRFFHLLSTFASFFAFTNAEKQSSLFLRTLCARIRRAPMKKTLRIALAAAVLASFAPVALADDAPGGGVPQPQATQVSTVSAAITLILSVLGL